MESKEFVFVCFLHAGFWHASVSLAQDSPAHMTPLCEFTLGVRFSMSGVLFEENLLSFLERHSVSATDRVWFVLAVEDIHNLKVKHIRNVEDILLHFCGICKRIPTAVLFWDQHARKVVEMHELVPEPYHIRRMLIELLFPQSELQIMNPLIESIVKNITFQPKMSSVLSELRVHEQLCSVELSVSVVKRHIAALRKRTREAEQLAQAFGVERLKYDNNCWQSPTDLASAATLPCDLRDCCQKIAWLMPEAYIGLRLEDNTTVIVHNYPGQTTGHMLHLGDTPFEIVWPTVTAGFMSDTARLSRAQHDAVAEAIHANIAKLLAPNVVAVFAASGLRVGNNVVSVPCIRVVVLSKGIIPFGSWVLPAAIGGFPVDVVDGSLPTLQMMNADDDANGGFPDDDENSISVTRPSYLNLCEPLVSGSAIEVGDISHPQRSNVGTFSGVVRRRSGDLAGLTCAHVISTGIGQVYRTHHLLGLDWLTRRVILGQRIAGAVVEGCTTGPEEKFVDCGLFTLNVAARTALNNSLQSSWDRVFHIPQVPRLAGVGKAAAFDRVYKHGQRSGLTNGTVCSDGYVQERYPQGWPYIAPSKQRYRLTATHCFFISRYGFEQFSKDGDSGALVFRLDDPASDAPTATVLGIVFGGWDQEHTSFASHIHDVQDSLDCELYFN